MNKLVINKESGSGNGSFTIAADSANNTHSDITKSVIVTNEDGRTKTVTFIQHGRSKITSIQNGDDVTADASTIEVLVNDKWDAPLVVSPSNALYNLLVVSSDPSVATAEIVNNNILRVYGQSDGQCTVTVTDISKDGWTGSLVLNVISVELDISLDNITLNVGETHNARNDIEFWPPTLNNRIIAPSNRNLSWRSGDESKFTVDSNGVVTAIAPCKSTASERYYLEVTDTVTGAVTDAPVEVLANEYTVTKTVSANASISDGGATVVAAGGTYTGTVTTSDGYTPSVTVTMGGTALPNAYDASTGIITIPNVSGVIEITVTASINTHTISVAKPNDVTMSNSNTRVAYGSSYTNTFTAPEGYVIDTITCTMDGNPAGTVSGNTLTISRITGDVAVTVTKSKADFIVKENGNVVSDIVVDADNVDLHTFDVTASGAWTVNVN